MVDFYGEMQKIATNLIGEFQQGVIQYIGLTHSGGTPDNPGEPVETATTINAVARGVQYRYIDGTNITATDGQITMPVVNGLTPSINGFISIDGSRHRIVSVTAIPPAGTPVAYRVIFKR